MGRTCAVISCTSAGAMEGVSFFRIPTVHRLAQEWLGFLEEVNNSKLPTETKGLLICSKHFRKCCINIGSDKRTVVNGHFPTVLDGKVLPNIRSKCLPPTREENLQKFSLPDPLKRKILTKSRQGLSEKLTSLSIPKIVLEKLPLMPVATEANPRKNEISPEMGEFIPSSPVLQNSTSLNFSAKTETDEYIIPDVEEEVFPKAQVKLPPPAKATKRKYPSSLNKENIRNDNKIIRLRNENKILRKSVETLEKQMGEIQEQVRSLKKVTDFMGEQYKILLSAYQNGIGESGESSANNNGLRCKCVMCNVEVVDISDD